MNSPNNPPNPTASVVTELKPCPFCGKPPLIVCPDNSYGSAMITCGDANECPVDLTAWGDLATGETIEDAVRAWNTRTDQPPPHTGLTDVERLVAEWKRLEDVFHDNLPSQGECGDPSHGKALCQFLYDNSETLRAALLVSNRREVERLEQRLLAFVDRPNWSPDAVEPENHPEWRAGYEAAQANLREELKPWWPFGGPLNLAALDEGEG